MSVKNWIKLFFLGLVWGSSYFWIKIALREVGPVTLVFFRVLFATLGCLFFVLNAKTKFKTGWLWKFAFVGVFNICLPFILISWAEESISSGMASILNSTVPLFTIVIAPIFLKDEKLTIAKITGFLLGFAGVILLMSNRLGGDSKATVTGIAAMLIAAISYAVSGVFARKLMGNISIEAVSFGQMAGALVFILPAALIVDAPFRFPTLPTTYLALLWLGVLGSCICTLVWYSMLYSVGPIKTSMNSYLLPLVGVLLGAAILEEPIDWHVLAGGVLILLAVFIVNSRAARVQISQTEVLVDAKGK